MSGDERSNDNLAAGQTAGAASLDDLVGAYLLDALDADERAAFERHLAGSAIAREEVALLRPVVQLLPLALEDADDDVAITPSPSLRNRILTAARESDARMSSGAAAGDVGPRGAGTTTKQPTPLRPPGRIRAGTGGRGGVFDLARSTGFERLAAGLLALIAAGALIWGVTLQSRLSDRESELDDVRDELALERGDGGETVQAVVYTLDPTPDGPTTANGTVSLLTEGATDASLGMTGLPEAGEGRAYQLWFLDLDESGTPVGAPRPSVTFDVGADGTAFVQDVPVGQPFDAVAITNEPADGSETPSPPILMLGVRGTAQG